MRFQPADLLFNKLANLTSYTNTCEHDPYQTDIAPVSALCSASNDIRLIMGAYSELIRGCVSCVRLYWIEL